MIIILSPAKTLDFEINPTVKSTLPLFLNQAALIASQMKLFGVTELQSLLGISRKLAELNALRYAEWEVSHHATNGKPAVYVYKGDVYQGLQADLFNPAQVTFAQTHLRILSGLYGILRPLDAILPYRLEMGTQLRFQGFSDLYHFWKDLITRQLNNDLGATESKVLINLASEEYSGTVDLSKIEANIIQPVFKEYRNGRYQMVSFFAKKARGMMARFIITKQLSDPEDIKLFDAEGYHFNEPLSATRQWVFTRG